MNKSDAYNLKRKAAKVDRMAGKLKSEARHLHALASILTNSELHGLTDTLDSLVGATFQLSMDVNSAIMKYIKENKE